MKKKSSKKVNLSKMEYSDGVDHKKEKVRDLEKLLDMGSNNPYGTVDKDIFLERVETMSLEEMGNLANRVGVMLTNRSSLLKQRLIDAFEDFQKKHRAALGGVKTNVVDSNHPALTGIKDLLGFPVRLK